MNLLDLIQRTPAPQPWSEGDNIPWDEPGFSDRMLREHLSQEHDAASRRFPVIDTHVQWIHQVLLHSQPTQILDIGCGPGLYTQRLARLGHTCTGIDFSPASIRYAREQAAIERLSCTYHLGDLRLVDFNPSPGGGVYGLVMSIYGEFNVFKPSDAELILKKAHQALRPGGCLLLEPHSFSAMEKLGKQPPSWYSAKQGIFSAQPYLTLKESFWDEERRAATSRHWVLDAGTAQVNRFASSYQAYTQEEYRALLHRCGFMDITLYPSLMGQPGEPETDLIAITARTPS